MDLERNERTDARTDALVLSIFLPGSSSVSELVKFNHFVVLRSFSLGEMA